MMFMSVPIPESEADQKEALIEQVSALRAKLDIAKASLAKIRDAHSELMQRPEQFAVFLEADYALHHINEDPSQNGQ